MGVNSGGLLSVGGPSALSSWFWRWPLVLYPRSGPGTKNRTRNDTESTALPGAVCTALRYKRPLPIHEARQQEPSDKTHHNSNQASEDTRRGSRPNSGLGTENRSRNDTEEAAHGCAPGTAQECYAREPLP